MKNIISFIKNLFTVIKYDKPMLGRWNIESCNKKINYKIDLANEDHCGPCGTYIKNKKYLKKQIVNKL
jgi:hypothetical protein